MSDLHVDSQPFEFERRQEDLLIVAGDVGNGPKKIMALMDSLPEDLPVVFTLGNHDLYGSVFSEAVNEVRDHFSNKPNRFFLEKSSAEVGGVRFLGGIMFSDFQLNAFPHPDAIARVAGRSIRDFIAIKTAPDVFWTPENHKEEFRAFYRWLDFELSQPWEGPTVVITHFLPHPKSIDPAYSRSVLNPYFASNVESLMLKRPVTWIHGHTHSACDYMVEDTHVICNPRGYWHEEGQTGFGKFVYVDV